MGPAAARGWRRDMSTSTLVRPRSGPQILAYILLWIVMPNEDRTAY